MKRLASEESVKPHADEREQHNAERMNGGGQDKQG
jgi:hypothetical protein